MTTLLVHGTVLFALTWLMSVTVLKSVRPGVISTMWLLVFVKFIVPVMPALPISLNAARG